MKPTLKLLIDRIEAWCEAHTMITDFGHGPLPDMERYKKRTEWVLVYLVIQDPGISKFGVEFSFDFIVVAPTMQNPKTAQADLDSMKQVQSDLLQIVQDFIAEVRNGSTYFYHNGDAIAQFPNDQQIRALPILEKYHQWVAGYNVQIRLVTMDPLNQCDIPYNGEFTPPDVPETCAPATITINDQAFDTVDSGGTIDIDVVYDDDDTEAGYLEDGKWKVSRDAVECPDFVLNDILIKDDEGNDLITVPAIEVTWNEAENRYEIQPGLPYVTEASLKGTSRQFNKGQGATIVPLVDGTTEIDFQASNMWSLTLEENTTISAPTNNMPTSGVIFCKQDATGGFTLGWNAAWTVKGDDVPTAADAEFSISIYSDGAGRLVANILDES